MTVITDRKALSAAKTLLEYYRQWSKRVVLDPFVDEMCIRLENEVKWLSKEPTSKPR